MGEPQISVLMPVRDAAATLEQALRSVLASRGPSLELICVDDGSSDESAGILATWSRAETRGTRGLSRPWHPLMSCSPTSLRSAPIFAGS